MESILLVTGILLIIFVSYQISKLHEILIEWYSYWKRINRKEISKVGEEETHEFWNSLRRNLVSRKKEHSS